MTEATWIDCAGIANEGRAAHAQRDGCTSCAPWWERVAICPVCRHKLHKLGRTKCRNCKVWVMVKREAP